MASRTDSRRPRQTREARSGSIAEVLPERGDEDDDEMAPDEALGDLVFLESQGDDVTWTIYRISPEGTKLPPGFGPHAYAMTFAGAFDTEKVRERLGGGFFEIMGRRGRTMITKKRIVIEGAPRIHANPVDPPSPAPALSAATPSSRTDQLLEQLLVELRTMRAAPPPSALGVRDVIDVAKEISRHSGETPRPDEIVSTARQMLELGQELAKNDGDREPVTMATVLRDALPKVFELFERHPIVKTGAAPPARDVDASPAAQGNMLLELLTRGITFGRDPHQVADAAEELLSDVEVQRVRSLSADQLIGELKPTLDQYPQLTGSALEQVHVWLRTWHDALKHPPDAEA